MLVSRRGPCLLAWWLCGHCGHHQRWKSSPTRALMEGEEAPPGRRGNYRCSRLGIALVHAAAQAGVSTIRAANFMKFLGAPCIEDLKWSTELLAQVCFVHPRWELCSSGICSQVDAEHFLNSKHRKVFVMRARSHYTPTYIPTGVAASRMIRAC